MPAALCVVGDSRPAVFRGFCATCKLDMGVAWRKIVTDSEGQSGRRERQRAAEALRTHRASCRTFGGGRRR
jgi:hypothetical protein